MGMILAGQQAMLHRPYSVLCGKQAFRAALLYITTITTVVSISDRQRASQMPFVPMAWGKRMKEGISQPDAIRPYGLGQEDERRYQEDKSAQQGQHSGRLHPLHTLIISYNGKVEDKEDKSGREIRIPCDG